MARGRMLDRSIKLSKKIANTSMAGQWLYFRMLPFTDDHGKTFGDVEDIKAEILPKENVTEKKISSLLSELHNNELILWADGEVSQFVDWHNHQSLKGRPANSQFPDYQEVTGKGQKRSKKVNKDSERIASLSSLKLGSLKSFKQIQHLKLSDEEYQKLVEEFGGGRVDQIIDDMRNYAKLKNYTSAYLTARKWLNRNKETAPTPQQSAPEPQKNSYFCESCNVGFSALDGKCPTCGSEGL